ncbi:hypothetical protein ILUMI_21091 [Ignelater luminosus]|uniref:UNC93-like protein n=1 Tax=Ignelater luminosus TaxID=2038154 RepID=A0A8K0G487_IGNLU|nr:hypothetical protein ILUMI_21091 [Ignelater luminosus]
MGSLPNLSEIGKEEDSPIYYRTGLPQGQENFPRGPVQSFRNERCKIRYRQSERGDLPRPRRKMPPPTKWVPFDDLAIQQTAASSPASARSANLTHVVRRRDSLTSSIGATSVRRLISVVRNSHNRPGPHYSKRVLIRYLIVFCVSHLLINATFLPFLVLQGSVSIWTLPFHNSLPISINIGSFLIAVMFVLAAVSTLLGPYIVHRVGANVVFLLSYAVFSVFYAAHLYPTLYLLVPVYVILGLVLGQVSLCYIAFLMGISSKMSCAMSDDDDELRLARRTVIIRRFARAIKASQDLGLIFGSFVTAALITLWGQSVDGPAKTCGENEDLLNCSNCAQNNPCTACPYSNVSNGALKNCSAFEILQSSVIDFNAFVDNFFDIDEHGQRLCGAYACAAGFVINSNSSSTDYNVILPRTTSVLLSAVFIVFSMVSLVASGLGLGKLKTYVCQDTLESAHFIISLKAVKESFKDVKLQLAAPLAVFIGMEQAFIYSDFSKSYVVCTLGIQHLNLVFLGMGVLQSIAACTLSMLLKSIQRYYVVCVGFIFQCCVLMVQILWKPINDDPALFYVIPAVWGVCNAIWEILTFSLLTHLYTDNWSAPFCNSTFFRFLGLSISFAFHGFLCNWIKLYILAIFLIFAVFPFLWLEIRLAKSQKNLSVSRL